MKKTSIVVKEKDNFDINILINNTALIHSVTGKTGLLNVKTNTIIGEMDNYYTIYDTERGFYYQEKTIEEASQENNWKSRKIVRVYDAQEEKILIDNWELIRHFSYRYELSTFRSPVDGKIHLFDINVAREDTNIFDKALDDVQLLYEQSGDINLIITVNGKKGVYQHHPYMKSMGLIAPIKYDNIEKAPDIAGYVSNIIIYTINGKKFFTYNEFIYNRIVGQRSPEYDDIIVDEKHKKIIYCKKGSRIQVYNIKISKFLLDEKCDDVQFLCDVNKEIYDRRIEKNYFAITRNNLKGLLVVEVGVFRGVYCPSKEELLPTEYDDIEYHDYVFYPKKNGKTGLFIRFREQCSFSELDEVKDVLIEPTYDKIVNLDYGLFALYNGDRCDVYQITSSQKKLLIKDCKFVSSIVSDECIFEQNGSYGILFKALRKTVNNYDNIEYLGNGYYKVGRNGKSGINFYGNDIVPVQYDTVDMKFYKSSLSTNIVYFALEKNNSCLEFERMKHNNINPAYDGETNRSQEYKKIDFLDDIMVLRTETETLIYDYDEKLLKQLPITSQISVIYRKPTNGDKEKPIYVIDGKFHYYKSGKLEEVFVEENDLYITTYETETDSFELRTYNKDEHDAFCSVIDSSEEIEAEKSLIETSEKGFERSKYPTLVLKRVKKLK